MIEKTECGAPVGISGLIDRDGFDIPDLGYALLDAYAGKGYAREAARSVLSFADNRLQMRERCAIVSPDNVRSSHLLKEIGFTYSK